MWSGSGAAQVSALRLDKPASVNDSHSCEALCQSAPCIGVARLASSLQVTGHHFLKFGFWTAWDVRPEGW